MLTQELIVEKLTTNCSQVLHKYLPTARLPKIEFNRISLVARLGSALRVGVRVERYLCGVTRHASGLRERL